MNKFHRYFFWLTLATFSIALLPITAAKADSPQNQGEQMSSSANKAGSSHPATPQPTHPSSDSPARHAARSGVYQSKHQLKLSSNHRQTRPLSEDEAIDIVSKLPEVIKWQNELARAKKSGAGSAGFMADKEKNGWTVQAFESFPDRNVTFRFYIVDAKTRKAKTTEN